MTGGHRYDDYPVIFITSDCKGLQIHAAKVGTYDNVAAFSFLQMLFLDPCSLALPAGQKHACDYVHNVLKWPVKTFTNPCKSVQFAYKVKATLAL